MTVSKAMSDGLRVNQRDIQKAAQAVDTVCSIDQVITWMAKEIDANAETWGDSVRGALGRKMLTRLTDEHLGHVTFCAIINALLIERSELVDEWSGLVEFDAPPCKVQTLPLEI